MAQPAPRLTKETEPFIPYVPDAQVVERLRTVVEPYMKRMGFLPNALKLYAHRPEIAETLFRLNSNVMRDPSSTLDQGLKRKLSAIASNANGCTYCTAHCCNMLLKGPNSGAEGWELSDKDMYGLLTGAYRPKDEIERVCIDNELVMQIALEDFISRLYNCLADPPIQ